MTGFVITLGTMVVSPLTLRSSRELQQMRSAGLLVWQAHQLIAETVRPGVTTQEIDEAVADLYREYNAVPLFQGVSGKTPFPAVTCISVNEAVVHGIPGSRQLCEGDIVSVDTGCKVNGWCGDSAWTYAVGKIDDMAQSLLDITQGSLILAIEQLGKCRYWSEVARQIQVDVEQAGFSVVKEFVGHGVGREMHEPPQVPNFVSDEFLDKGDFELRAGLVLAIEPMVNMGCGEVLVLDDGWTQVTADGGLSAHFEHTVALTDEGPLILTGSPNKGERFS